MKKIQIRSQSWNVAASSSIGERSCKRARQPASGSRPPLRRASRGRCGRARSSIGSRRMAAVARQLRAGRRPGLLRLLGLLGLGLAAMLASTGGSVAKASATSAAAPPPCAAAGLVVWLDTREGRAAGSVYYRLELTNLGARTCSLRGYPGVSAVDLAGRQLG